MGMQTALIKIYALQITGPRWLRLSILGDTYLRLEEIRNKKDVKFRRETR